MTSIVYLNDQFISEEKAFVPITDRGFLFGDGVFTTLKVNDGYPELLELHLQRLEVDGKIIGIDIPKFTTEVVDELIKKNEAQKGVWRLKILISGGTHSEFDLKKRTKSQLIMTLKPYLSQKKSYRLISLPYSICSPFGNIKSLCYLDRFRVHEYAIQQGGDEALVYDYKGRILETSFANVFWTEGKKMYFPDPCLNYLQGITLGIVLNISKILGLKAKPVKVTLKKIPDKAQLYLCNSLRGIIPITTIDNKIFDRDLIFEKRLQAAYIQSIYSRL